MNDKPTQPRKRGAPRKCTPKTAKLLCELVAKGLPFRHACSVARIHVSTFCEWRNRDPRFNALIEAAIAEGVQARLEAILAASKTDWRAAAWLLEHCQPSEFARSRVESRVGQPAPEPVQMPARVILYLPDNGMRVFQEPNAIQGPELPEPEYTPLEGDQSENS